jgi:hypothetical protein
VLPRHSLVDGEDRPPVAVVEDRIPLFYVRTSSAEFVSVVARETDWDGESVWTRLGSIPVEAIPRLQPSGKIENLSAISLNDPGDGECLRLVNVQGLTISQSP